MERKIKQSTDRELAAQLIQMHGDAAISALFDHFGFDCMMRKNLDPCRMDELVLAFEKSGYCDLNLLSELIGMIREAKESNAQSGRALTEQIQQYILQHLAEDITMETVAAALHISYYYMCHFFKVQTGISPNAYRQQKRMEKAVRALLETNEKVSDIAVHCGFNNVSYFTESFTKQMGMAPSAFRSNCSFCVHPFYDLDDMRLAARISSVSFLEETVSEIPQSVVSRSSVQEPDACFSFLHEAAIIEYNGVLFASWYCCPEKELQGNTPICGRRSYDGGKTWSDIEIIAEDPSGKILYCPPVYGICDGKLYLLLNQMVAPDHIHALDLYVLDAETNRFVRLWSRPVPFKLNTNVIPLPNGKLMLPGRIAELDGFPNTPAVLISDSGKIDAEWRLVYVAPNGDLPDGKKLVHPEVTVVCENNILYLFNRNDQRQVPLVYTSADMGEHWSPLCAHDIPYIHSKIYADTLRDGRHYLVANTNRQDRSQLTLYFTEKGNMRFCKRLVLFDAKTMDEGTATMCHYPAACEGDGVLYIIATRSYGERRGAVLFKVDLTQV